MLAGHRLLNRRREPVVQDLQAGRDSRHQQDHRLPALREPAE